MDVVDEIAAVKVGRNDKTVEDVVIWESIFCVNKNIEKEGWDMSREDSFTGILLHKMRKILKYGSFFISCRRWREYLAGCSKRRLELNHCRRNMILKWQ